MMSANVSDLMGGKKMSAKGVRVEMDGEAIAVNLFIVVRYGSAIGDVAKKVQQMVRTALEGMDRLPGGGGQCPRGRHQLQLNQTN